MNGCDSNCGDLLVNIEGLNESLISITHEKWFQVGLGYNNLSFRNENPIFVPKGSIIVLKQNNTGKVALDKTGGLSGSDILVDCYPKCLSTHKINANENWRFFVESYFDFLTGKLLFKD